MQMAKLSIARLNLAVFLFVVQNAALLAEKPPQVSSCRLYKSLDHGSSWFEVGEGLPGSKRINALAIAERVCFAGTDGGVFVSTDAGRKWTASGMASTTRVQCLAVEGRRVYAGTSTEGVYVTTDGGHSWNRVDLGLVDLKVRSLATRGPVVFAGTDSRGVFMHTGGDEGWVSFGEGLPERPQIFDLEFKGRWLYAALYSKGLYRIEASGGRWERVGRVSPLEFLVRGDALVAGLNPGGISRSVDGGATWSPAGGLPGGPPIWVLGGAGPNILAGTSPGAVVLSDDLGETWKPSAAGLPQGAAVIALGDGGDYTLAAIVLPGRS